MLRLAIDTSSPLSSVAIVNDDGTVVSRESASRDSHSQSLDTMVKGVAEEAGIGSFADFEQLLIGLGPGSFTGLRIGLSYVKGISLAHRIPIVGVSSFTAMALSAAQTGDLIAVVSDARREEFFFAGFRKLPHGLEEIDSLQICSQNKIKEFFQSTRGPVSSRRLLIDAGNELLPDVDAPIVPANSIAAGILMMPAETREWSIASLSAIEPLYTRAVAALTVEERSALRSQKV